MTRLAFAALATFAFSLVTYADPVKKTVAVDSDKLCKECADAFIKAIVDGKVDDAIKQCATPFREPDGKKSDTLDGLKKEFDRGVPPGIEIKTGKVLTIEKFKESIKEGDKKDTIDELIKEYGEYLGKDGRIVILDVKLMGQAPPDGQQPHVLVRVKDGKAQIVGVGGR